VNSDFVASAPPCKLRFRLPAKATIYVGEYFADFLVEDELVIELRCVEHLGDEHTAQFLNYLRASNGRSVCSSVPQTQSAVEANRPGLQFKTHHREFYPRESALIGGRQSACALLFPRQHPKEWGRR